MQRRGDPQLRPSTSNQDTGTILHNSAPVFLSCEVHIVACACCWLVSSRFTPATGTITGMIRTLGLWATKH